MSVTLRKRKNANGSISLRLDIYRDGKHHIETLKHLQLVKVSNVADKQKNKEFYQQAQTIAITYAAQLEGNNYNIKSKSGKNTVITNWMQNYIDNYRKKDVRNMQGALNRFSEFLTTKSKCGLVFGDLTVLIIEDFIDYLQAKSKGEGAKSYYARFKKMIKYAYRSKVIEENILDFVEKKVKGKAKDKDILTLEEIKILANTPIKSSKIKNAALFSAFTGLAWVDIKNLSWDNIKLETKKLEIVRHKLDDYNETISIHLNANALAQLGVKGKPTDKVFKLPTPDGANKTLKAWVKRAKIDKSITWHNLRHSFGTNLILNDVNIVDTGRLLGHGTLNQTLRYVKKAGEIKANETDKINIDL